jgi:ADP-ribose pyrophosphatase YjhB (NUDIX family)
MGRKIDYHNDPNAPKANSIVPAVSVVVTNERDEILLIRRTDNENWSLPGGAIEIGESLTQAAVRETKEETGIDCEITGLVGIYTDPGHIIHYTSNDEVRQEFSIVLTARASGGKPSVSQESREVRWLPSGIVDQCQMDDSMRLRLEHYLEHRSSPYIGTS